MSTHCYGRNNFILRNPFNFAQIVFTYILVHSILIHTTADEIVKSYIDRYIFSRPGDYPFEML